jgi:glycerophosphoryl diester phosphodiesterase
MMVSRDFVTWFVSLFVMAAFAISISTCRQSHGACTVVAHRGFSAIAPENTLAAARKAVEIGAYGSEFDVYASADGALVVMHDKKIDRTTNGKGEVTKLSLAQLRGLDAGSWKGREFAGQRVPTLEEMLALLKHSGCRPVIEIKGQRIADKVIAAVRAAGMVDQAIVISFHKAAVKAVRTLEPRIPCALLCDKTPPEVSPGDEADWIIDQARQCKTNFLDLSHKMLTAPIVAQLQRHGMTVWAWTVDDPGRMDELIHWGVGSITTNRPDLLQDRLHAAQQEVCRSASRQPRIKTGTRRAKSRWLSNPRVHRRVRDNG